MKKKHLALCMTSLFLMGGCMVSCSDVEEKQEEKSGFVYKNQKDRLMDIFYSEEFCEVFLDKGKLDDFLLSVEKEYAIDIEKFSHSKGIETLDSLTLDSCFLKQIEADLVPVGTMLRLEEIANLLPVAEAANDTIKMQELIVEAHNLSKCKPIDKNTRIEEQYDVLAADVVTVQRGMQWIEKEYPIFSEIDSESQNFILTLAMVYRQKEYLSNIKAAPISCKQRCELKYERDVKKAYIDYTLSMASCALLTPGIITGLACATIASVTLYTTMDNIVADRKDCISGC